jgi:hypothetical protein
MSSMPVSQLDTATTVASTGTKEAWFGIEWRSVLAAPAVVKPRTRDKVENRACRHPRNRLALSVLMPSTFANAEHVSRSIISFAKITALPRS